MTPADAQQLAAVTSTIVVISLAIGIGVYVWYSVMLAKVFAHLGLAQWSAWVPVYSQMQVFRLGGQNPWLALLLYVPIAQLVGLVFQVMALHRISGQYWRGVGTTVVGVLLPPVWATILAAGPSPDPERGRMPRRGASTGPIPPVAPSGPLAASVAAVASGWAATAAAPAAPPAMATATAMPVAAAPTRTAWPAGDAAPILPAWADPQPRADGPITPVPAPSAPPAVVAAPRIVPATPAAPAPSVGSGGDAAWPLGTPVGDPVSRIPGRIEPLPVLPVASAAHLNAAKSAPVAGSALPALPTLPSALPAVGQPLAAPEPPAAPEPTAVAEETSLARPRDSVEAAAAVAPPAFAELLAAGSVVTGDDELEDDLLDRTVVVDRRPIVTWRLVTEGGEALRLAGTVVLLGRNPRPANPGIGEQRLVVPDPSRTLSKTHAVLRLDGEQWSITDLDSTNGVLVPDWEGVDRLLDPGVPTPVPDRFVLGTLSVRIERDPPAAGVSGR